MENISNSTPIFLAGLIVAVITICLTLVYFEENSLPHATTCPEIDDILTSNLLGEIELSNNQFNDLVNAMIWCMEKGYEVKPLGGTT